MLASRRLLKTQGLDGVPAALATARQDRAGARAPQLPGHATRSVRTSEIAVRRTAHFLHVAIRDELTPARFAAHNPFLFWRGISSWI